MELGVVVVYFLFLGGGGESASGGAKGNGGESALELGVLSFFGGRGGESASGLGVLSSAGNGGESASGGAEGVQSTLLCRARFFAEHTSLQTAPSSSLQSALPPKEG